MMEKFRIQEDQARELYQPAIDSAKKAVDEIQKNIQSTTDKFGKLLEPLETESKVLSNSLSIIDNKSQEINDKYDVQEKTLQKISDINQEIAEQEKGRISLADALTQGDISAAASAAQEMRAQAAQRSIEKNNLALESSRQKELNAIKVNGMTRIDIEKRQYAISQQQYTIEQQRDTLLKEYDQQLKTANTTLDLAQEKLDNQIELIVSQRKQWESAKLKIDAAESSVRTMNITLKDQLKLVQDIVAAWEAARLAQLNSSVTSINPKPTVDNNEDPNIKPDPNSGDNSKDKIQTDTTTSTSSNFNYNSGNPLFGIIPTPKTSTPTSTKSAATNFAYNSGINNPISKVISTVTSPISKVVSTVASIPSKIASSVVAGTKTLVSNIGKSIFSLGRANGGIIPKYYVSGGYSRGSDTIPAMLTPGEFVIRKNAVDSFGVNNLNKINDGSYSGSSVYNYNLNLNVKSESNADDIARTVMTQIKRIDNQRIRTQRGL